MSYRDPLKGVDRDRLVAALEHVTAQGHEWEEEPMPLDRWLRDPRMGHHDVRLSDIQMDALLHGERVLRPETIAELGWDKTLSPLTGKPIRQVMTMDLAWGKGSGKGLISTMTQGRIAYLLLCLRSPQAYYLMPASELISMTNIATAATQAQLAFFERWSNRLGSSPWFRERMDFKKSRIEFAKNLVAISGHSSIESQEGLNLIIAVLDELSGFKTAAELGANQTISDRLPPRSAEGIHTMAMESVRSRFGILGKVMAMAFTYYRGDPIDSRVTEGHAEIEEKGDASTRYASRAATWEVHPHKTRAQVEAGEELDPQQFQARYECRPAAGAYTYFRNVFAVRRSMGVPLLQDPLKGGVEAVPTVGITYHYGIDTENQDLVAMGKEPSEDWYVRFDTSRLTHHGYPLAIHMDLGLNRDGSRGGDRCGLAASHVSGIARTPKVITDPKTGIESTEWYLRPNVVSDWAIVFEGQAPGSQPGAPGTEIKINWVESLMYQLMSEGWHIGWFSADGYQSVGTMQMVESWGATVEKFSLDTKTEGYDTLKSLVYEGRVTVPYHPLLYDEITRLMRVRHNKIDHPTGGSKDMADAWAGSVRGAVRMSEVHGWRGPEAEAPAPEAAQLGWTMDEQRYSDAHAPMSADERRFTDAM